MSRGQVVSELVLRMGGSEAETVSDRVQESMDSASREKSMVGMRNECCDIASVGEKVWQKIWSKIKWVVFEGC